LTSAETLQALYVVLSDDEGALESSQAVGFVAHRLGFEGLLVPAVGGDHTNLVVFELNLAASSLVVEESTTIWEKVSDLP